MRKKTILSLLMGILLVNVVSAANVVSSVAGGLGDKIFSGILWFGLAMMVVVGIGSIFVFIIWKRRFNITVKIISKRAKDKNNILFDKAAIIVDRNDKSKYFHVLKTNVKLPVPDFNVLQNSSDGDYIELYRSSEDRFYFLTPSKVSEKILRKEGGMVVPMRDQSSIGIVPEMDFWTTKRKHLNKGMFVTENMWMKILPYVPHIISGVLVIFILWILMSHLPGILQQLSELTTKLNQQQTAQVVTG